MPEPNKLEWDKATQAVKDASSVLIVTHVNPDGDAIGSMLGLGAALQNMDKTVTTAVDDGVPKSLRFLTGADDVYAKLTTRKFDLLIAVDAGDEERTGDVGAYGRRNSQTEINLDHHPTNTFFGDIHLISAEAVSATEIVARWLEHMNQPLTDDIAACLLTGLVTDTMGFRTSNVTADTLGIAQKLMEPGVSLRDITARTLESKAFNSIKLWGQVLDSVELEDGVVSVNITRADQDAISKEDTSDAGLVGLLNQIDEAQVAVVFTELPDDRVKLNFRSKLGYDVGSVALELGGGGHTQASGARVDGTLEDVRERVLPLLKQAVKDGEANIA